MLDTFFDYVRYGLYLLLVLLCFLLFQAWDKDHPKQIITTQTTTANEHFVPTMPATATAGTAAPAAAGPVPSLDTAPAASAGQVVTVATDLLQVKLDTQGGEIINTELLKFPAQLGSPAPIVIFNDDPNSRYIAESGLLSTRGPDTTSSQATYTVDQTAYTMSPDQNDLTITLRWQNNDGLAINKIFTFQRGSYEIKVAYHIVNNTDQVYEANLYTQLMRTNTPPPNNSGFINLATYFGAAVSSVNAPFTKISFKDMENGNLNQSIQDGWAAMIQHYFVTAWIPPKTATSNYYTRVLPNGLYAIGMVGQPIVVPPKQSASTEAKLFVGPAMTDILEKAAPALKLTVDYGWFWFISAIIFWMMQKIYDVVGNWGWSIVFVTIIIKILFYQLSAKSFRSMAAMKKLQPKIEALKKQHADDKQKMTQATLDLYRQEKVNPMSGCLPIIVQIPVFIALYWVLVESVQLRQAPFILWIHDLSQHDPYYILPLFMGISMFLQQRLNPPPPDPVQAKVMMLMPVVFTVMFASFPAGLMLYWFVNNTLSFLQQWYVMHRMEKDIAKKKH